MVKNKNKSNKVVLIILSFLTLIASILTGFYFFKKKNNKASGSTKVFNGEKDVTNNYNRSPSLGNINNPGNLIRTNDNWQGKVNNNTGRFVAFDTMSNGARAWLKNLKGHIDRGTITSIDTMIDVLTPSGENSEKARNNYKKFVKDALTSSNNSNNLLALQKAVYHFEGNIDWLNSSENEKNEAVLYAIEQVYDGVITNPLII